MTVIDQRLLRPVESTNIPGLGSDLLFWFNPSTAVKAGGGVPVQDSLIERVTAFRASGSYAVEQGTTAKQGLFEANLIDSRPAIHFDGVDDWMSTENIDPFDKQTIELWAVTKQDAGGTLSILSSNEDTADSFAVWRTASNVMEWSIRDGTGDTQDAIAGTTGLGTAVPHLLRTVIPGSETKHYVDGVLEVNNDRLGTDTGRCFGDLTAGRSYVVIGAYRNGGTPTSFFNGKIADLVVTNELSAGKATTLAAWFAARYPSI